MSPFPGPKHKKNPPRPPPPSPPCGAARASLSLRLFPRLSAQQSIAFGVRERSRLRVGAPTVRSTHPPARARVWVSYEANPGNCVVSDPASEPCHELPGVLGDWGLWVAARAWRRRPIPGPVLLCQPCGGHPLLVRKSSVSYPSVCCVNAWYSARCAAYLPGLWYNGCA